MLKPISQAAMVLFMLPIHLGYGQSTTTSASLQESPLTIEGFDYPTFDGLSNYAWFKVNLALTETTEFSIGGEHYRRIFADRFGIPIQLKQYINDNTYILGGYQREWDLLNDGRGYPNPIPREEIYFGVGHDVQPNMMIEAKMVQPFGNAKFYSMGLEGVQSSLRLGTRLKF